MKENTNKKSYIVFAVITVIAFIGLYAYSIYKTGGSSQKKKIENIATEYIQANYPELAGRIELGNKGAYFYPTGKNRNGQDAGTEWWEGQWNLMYNIDGDDRQFFYLNYNRMGDKLLFDGYKEHYLKGGMLMRKKQYEFYDYINDLFTKDKNDGIRNKTQKEFHDAVLQPVFVDYNSENGYIDSIGDDFLRPYTGPVLDLDKEYNMKELAKSHARLQFQFSNKERTVDTVYRLREEIKDFIIKNNIEFFDINITIDTFYGIYNIPADEFLNGDLKTVVGKNTMTMFEYRNKVNFEE